MCHKPPQSIDWLLFMKSVSISLAAFSLSVFGYHVTEEPFRYIFLGCGAVSLVLVLASYRIYSSI